MELTMSKCPYGCNYDCSCLKKKLVLLVNNVCNKDCHYCTQKHNLNKTHINYDKFISNLRRTDVDEIAIMGGEFTLLPKSDQERIFDLILNNSIEICICTNNPLIYVPNIKFNYHITDFSYIPQPRKDCVYNLVINNKELQLIYNYVSSFNDVTFYLYYDWITYNPIEDVTLLLKLLKLPNIRVQAYSKIYKLYSSNISKKYVHFLIQRFMRSLCNSELVTCYEG